jgi:uncharacterized protein YceK
MRFSGDQRLRSETIRLRSLIVVFLVVFGTLITLSGCSGPSTEETARQTEEGKQTNEDAMKRMINEQGRLNPQPGGTGQ